MKKFLLVLLFFIALSSCRKETPVVPKTETYVIQSGEGVDGYVIEQATMIHQNINLKVHMYRSYDEFEKANNNSGNKSKPGSQTMGFAYFDEKTNYCEIHIYDPAYFYGPEWIGHELVHCIYGDFHPSRN